MQQSNEASHHNYRAGMLGPTSSRSRPAITEACLPRACGPHSKRSHNERAASTGCRSRKPVSSHKDPAWPKMNRWIHSFRKRIWCRYEILLGNAATWGSHKEAKGRELYSVMVTVLIVPFIRYSWKGKITGTETRSVISRGCCQGERNNSDYKEILREIPVWRKYSLP